MTEQEWLNCAQPGDMIDHLNESRSPQEEGASCCETIECSEAASLLLWRVPPHLGFDH